MKPGLSHLHRSLLHKTCRPPECWLPERCRSILGCTSDKLLSGFLDCMLRLGTKRRPTNLQITLHNSRGWNRVIIWGSKVSCLTVLSELCYQRTMEVVVLFTSLTSVVHVYFRFKDVTKECSFNTESNCCKINAFLLYRVCQCAMDKIIPVFAQYVPAGHEVHSELPACAQGVVKSGLRVVRQHFHRSASAGWRENLMHLIGQDA